MFFLWYFLRSIVYIYDSCSKETNNKNILFLKSLATVNWMIIITSDWVLLFCFFTSSFLIERKKKHTQRSQKCSFCWTISILRRRSIHPKYVFVRISNETLTKKTFCCESKSERERETLMNSKTSNGRSTSDIETYANKVCEYLLFHWRIVDPRSKVIIIPSKSTKFEMWEWWAQYA